MKYIELRKSLKKLRISIKEFSVLIGFTYTSVTRWNSAEVPYWVSVFIDSIERLSLEEREKFFTEKLGEK
jgi:hypothetical protein